MATRFKSVIAFLAAGVVVATAACASDPASNIDATIEAGIATTMVAPDVATDHLNRGQTYLELGEYEKAIQEYDKAIQLDPNYALAYHHRGNAYRELGIKGKAYADKMQACYLDKQYC
jgi:Tfp pilus assembly protein PilF